MDPISENTQTPTQDAGSSSPHGNPFLLGVPVEQPQQILRNSNPQTRMQMGQLGQLYGQPRRPSNPTLGSQGFLQRGEGRADNPDSEVDNTGPPVDAQTAAGGQERTLFNLPGDPPNLGYRGPPLAPPVRRPAPNPGNAIPQHCPQPLEVQNQPATPAQPQHPYQSGPHAPLAPLPRLETLVSALGTHYRLEVPRVQHYHITAIMGRTSGHSVETTPDGAMRIFFCWGSCCYSLRAYVGIPTSAMQAKYDLTRHSNHPSSLYSLLTSLSVHIMNDCSGCQLGHRQHS